MNCNTEHQHSKRHGGCLVATLHGLHSVILLLIKSRIVVVGYLTQDSDLDLTPDHDQFGTLPQVGLGLKSLYSLR